MTVRTSDDGSPSAIIGRGARDGARLFREWYDSLSRAAEEGQQTAYVFVMGSLAEVLRSFDFQLVFPEVNSLQTAVRRVAHEYLNEAEDYGFSPDVCGYVKADVALQLRGGKHPMGRVPEPTIAVLTNACNTYIKWAEIWERLYQIPVFTLDIPGTRMAGGQTWPGMDDFERDRTYVERQLEELITRCEQVSRRRFDIDRLREVMAQTNALNRSWRQLLTLNRAHPAPFNAVTDATIFLGVSNGFRGTAEGSTYFRELTEEMRLKVQRGLGTIQGEQSRLVFVGVPCYPIFRRFNDLFAERGGVFVGSTYLWFASGGAAVEYEYDLQQPLRSLAEGLLISVRHAMDSMFFQEKALIDLIDPYDIDGIVFHAVKSCRTVSTGLADVRRSILAARDIGTLFLESDMMDKRTVSEAQLKNRVDAFFEGLDSRKRAAAGLGPTE